MHERAPINLFLKKIRFDGFLENHLPSIRENWLTVQVPVKYLHLDDFTATIIHEDAFNVDQFENLNELVIQSRITKIDNMAFNGLKNLKKLTLRGIEMEEFEQNTLEPLETLQWFTMENCMYSENSKVLSVNNLFGIYLPHLTRVKIMDCNLGKTINQLTFQGLKGINEIILVSDRIEEIGEESFDVAFTSLTHLNLAKNRLRSLPRDIFDIRKGLTTTIKLDSNLWHCGCSLEGLRKFILHSFNDDVKKTVCKTPIEYAGQRIYDLPSLCIDEIKPTPSSFFTEIMIPDDRNSWAHSLELQRELSNDSTVIHCGAINVKKYVTLKKSTKIRFPLICIKNGNLVLYTAHLSKDFFYFGYEQSFKKILKCVGNSMGDKVRKIQIAMSPNQMYRLCRIKRKHNSITPLECIPYFTNYDADRLDAWIKMKYKGTFVWIFIFTGILMPFIGILISTLLAKLFPKFIRGNTLLTKQTLSPIPKQHAAFERFRSIRFVAIFFFIEKRIIFSLINRFQLCF